jgi:hypothetical protein
MVISRRPDAPKPRGKTLVARLFVDSDHPGDELFRRLRTAPIIWYSKLPGDCEDVGFGAVLCSLQ